MADTNFSKPPASTYTETPPQIDVSEFRKVIASRRSVRVYDSTPVPPDVVNECLDWALLAPNSSNLQSWEFVWVRTPETKKRLAEICMGQSAATTAPELLVFLARIDRIREVARDMVALFEKSESNVPDAAINYYKKLVPLVYTQGFLGWFGALKALFWVGAGLFRPVPREPVTRGQLITWAVKTCALACENFMLGMRAHGFDTCPMEGFDSKRLRRLLKLPRGAIPVMVISCGKRAPNGVYGPRVRFARERFVREV